jgi:division protein CdvB (Snf7/Vps24/ESCRT-III family)
VKHEVAKRQICDAVMVRQLLWRICKTGSLSRQLQAQVSDSQLCGNDDRTMVSIRNLVEVACINKQTLQLKLILNRSLTW